MKTPILVTPVHIRQVQESKESESGQFQVDGFDLGHAQIVAEVGGSTEPTANSVSLLLKDHTGQIDCRIWLHDPNSSSTSWSSASRQLASQEMSQWVQGSFVSVICTVSTFANRRALTALRVRLVTDVTEVEYHKAMVRYVSGLKQHGKFNAPTRSDAPTANAPVGDPMHVELNQDVTAGANAPPGMTDVQGRIFEMAKVGPATGVSRDELKARLQNTATGEQVDEAIDFLTSEGHLYTTTDEHHFRTT